MDERGAPTPVAWTRLRAPQSLMAPAPADQVAAAVDASPAKAKYAAAVDRESAYEQLAAKVQAGTGQATPEPQNQPGPPRSRAREEKSTVEKVIGSSVFKQFARSAGREIVRGLFGAARRRR